MLSGLLMVASIASASPILSLDFTSGNGDMANANGLQWQWNEIGLGPTGFTGPAWATQPSGDYLNDASDSLTLPELDLSSTDRPVLVLDHWFEIDRTGAGDLGWVELEQDGTTVRLFPIHGYPSEQGFSGESGDFQTDYFDLSGIDNASNVRFIFEADSAVTRAGWVIRGLTIDDADPVPPTIQSVTELIDTQDISGPYVVHAEIHDDLMPPQAILHWRVDSRPQVSVDMVHVGADLYRAEIEGADPSSQIVWWIRATDGTNTAVWPRVDRASFGVFLAPPTALNAPGAWPDGRTAGLELSLQWEAPDSPHTLIHTVLFRDGERVGTTQGTSALVPMVSARHSLSVAGFFDTDQGHFVGEESEPIDLRIALPSAAKLRPDHGFQGDTLRIEVEGINLLMAEDQVALLLGDGIELTTIEIVDADSAIVTAQIDQSAHTELRDATLLSGPHSIPLPGGFEVLHGDARPRVIEVSPRSIKQGSEVRLMVRTNAELEALPSIDLGEGVVVRSVELDGTIIYIDLTTTVDSPVGEHTILIDDGRRVLDGATVEVRDAKPAPGKLCAVVADEPPDLWLFGLVLLVWRRRRGVVHVSSTTVEVDQNRIG
jgi:hypothetical protein